MREMLCFTGRAGVDRQCTFRERCAHERHPLRACYLPANFWLRTIQIHPGDFTCAHKYGAHEAGCSIVHKETHAIVMLGAVPNTREQSSLQPAASTLQISPNKIVHRDRYHEESWFPSESLTSLSSADWRGLSDPDALVLGVANLTVVKVERVPRSWRLRSWTRRSW